MLSTLTKVPFSFMLTLLLSLTVINSFAVGQTTRVSVNSSNVQSNNHSYNASISANGRFVAFASAASNLVSGDTNKSTDVFLHDRLTRQTIRVSVDSKGIQGNAASGEETYFSHAVNLSADGRFVVFESKATNLVSGDTNSVQDIFVHDRITKKTTRVNVNSNGEQAFDSDIYSAISYNPAISADGRFIAFVSLASNLVVGDTNDFLDVFIHDRLTAKTNRVSVASNGRQALFGSFGKISLNADGRYIAFFSSSDDLVANDDNGLTDLFIYDRITQQTSRINRNAINLQVNSRSTIPSLSANGRYVAFNSWASNIVNEDKGQEDVFVHDRLIHQTTRISVTSKGLQANGSSSNPSLSADGRYVAFVSLASNLVTTDTNKTADTFVHDRLNKKTILASVNTNEIQGNKQSGSFSLNPNTYPTMSANGRYVTLGSLASNLAIGDSNNKADIFIRDSKLTTVDSTDLQLAATIKPATLMANSQGSYTYTITNNGPFPANANITYLVSNGNVTTFAPSQGSCYRYANINLCNLGTLLPGKNMTLSITVKALRAPLNQQLTLSSTGQSDPNKLNNYLTVATPVTP